MSIDFERECNDCPFIIDMRQRQIEISDELKTRDLQYINQSIIDITLITESHIRAENIAIESPKQAALFEKCGEMLEKISALHSDVLGAYAAARTTQRAIYKLAEMCAQATCEGIEVPTNETSRSRCTSDTSRYYNSFDASNKKQS